MALVAPEAPSEQARRVFQTYDPEGKKFYYFIGKYVDFVFHVYLYTLEIVDIYLSFSHKNCISLTF